MIYACWIAPDDKIIEVPITHIKRILENPEMFGLSKDKILATYKKYNEKVGLEGKARHEILLDLIKKGWIRIRYMPKNDSWTVEIYDYNEITNNQIRGWIQKSKKLVHPFSEVRILSNTGEVIKSSIKDWL